MRHSNIKLSPPWQFYVICAAVTVAGATLSLTISYLLALAGEPSSLWLWRDVLGVLR